MQAVGAAVDHRRSERRDDSRSAVSRIFWPATCRKKVLGRDDKTLKATGRSDPGIPRHGSRARADLLADALIDDHEKPRDHFVQVTANLVPAFRGVTGGKMESLLSSPDPQLTWKNVVEERKVVYFAMSSLLYGEVANRIGRVILQDLIGFLGERYAFDDPAKMTPLTILIDEFSATSPIRVSLTRSTRGAAPRRTSCWRCRAWRTLRRRWAGTARSGYWTT